MIIKFHLPTKLIFGSGSLERLGVEARELGQKAILVTGRSSMRRTGVIDKVVHNLRANGVSALVYDRVESNPRVSTVDEGAKLAREEEVELVIGMGGGSTMDAAKGIAVASSGSKSIWDYIVDKTQVEGPVPPIIQVPTVAASGSEANQWAVVTNWEIHEKRTLVSPFAFARVSIIDPTLTITLPKKPTSQAGIDIFAHIVEPYLTATTPTALTDSLLEAQMRLVVEYLPKVLNKLDDIEARSTLSWIAFLTCSQFLDLGGGVGVTPAHTLEHGLSAYFDIAHGDGLAAVLPSWMRYILPTKQERLQSLGRNVFGQTDGIEATEQWLEKMDMKLRLRELGIDPKYFEEMATNAVSTSLAASPQSSVTVDYTWYRNHPDYLDAAAAVQIYKESY